jgi:hypothetical protein
MLRVVLKKNLKIWEDCLPHAEFAYNNAIHSTTNFCPFEVVYSFKPHTRIDLLPLPLQKSVNLDATKMSEFIKKLHENTRKIIEKKICTIRETSKQGLKKIVF